MTRSRTSYAAYDEVMKKLILTAIAAAGGFMVFKLLNSEYQPPPEP